MDKLTWKPIEPRAKYMSSNSMTFVLKGNNNNYLFITGVYQTFLFQFTVNDKFSFICSKEIESQEAIKKITGNEHFVLMLDAKNHLHYLQITVDDSVMKFEPSLNYNLLNNNVKLSWVQVTELKNCLDIIGVMDGILVLYHGLGLYAGFLKSDEIKPGAAFISKKVNEFNSGISFHLFPITGQMGKIICSKVFKTVMQEEEIVLIIEPTQIKFWKSGHILSQSYMVNLHEQHVVNVIYFERNALILIICRSGKIFRLNFQNLNTGFKLDHTFLYEQVYTILGYSNYLFWSDLHDLHISKVTDDGNIHNVIVDFNIKGIKLLTKFHDIILAVSVNGFFYEGSANEFNSDETVSESSTDQLHKLCSQGVLIDELKKRLVGKDEMVKSIAVLFGDISTDIKVLLKSNVIILENKTRYKFSKLLWTVKIEHEEYGRMRAEHLRLENDILPGDCVSFDYRNNLKSIALLFSTKSKTYSVKLNMDCESKDNEKDELYELKQLLKENLYLSKQ